MNKDHFKLKQIKTEYQTLINLLSKASVTKNMAKFYTKKWSKSLKLKK